MKKLLPIIILLIPVLSQAISRPDKQFRIFQFSQDQIPRIDGSFIKKDSANLNFLPFTDLHFKRAKPHPFIRYCRRMGDHLDRFRTRGKGSVLQSVGCRHTMMDR